MTKWLLKASVAFICGAVFIGAPVAMFAAPAPPYCYPAGRYWQKQIQSYPDYYRQHNQQYENLYGVGTPSC